MNDPNDSARPELCDATLLEARFLGRLRWFAARWLGDAQAAEDAAQEALRRVVQALAEDRVRNTAALPGFVYQTARHVCLHHRRRAGRERRMLLRYGADRTLDEPAPDPLHALISEERKVSVQRALAAIAAEDRELLAALYVREESPREVAAKLNVSEGALRTRKHRALKRLSRQLAVDGGPG